MTWISAVTRLFFRTKTGVTARGPLHLPDSSRRLLCGSMATYLLVEGVAMIVSGRDACRALIAIGPPLAMAAALMLAVMRLREIQRASSAVYLLPSSLIWPLVLALLWPIWCVRRGSKAGSFSQVTA